MASFKWSLRALRLTAMRRKLWCATIRMRLRDLKQKPVTELVGLAREMGIEGAAGMRRQDAIFAILQAVAAKDGKDGSVVADGILECLPDGFGFLRSPDYNYLPSAD